MSHHSPRQDFLAADQAPRTKPAKAKKVEYSFHPEWQALVPDSADCETGVQAPKNPPEREAPRPSLSRRPSDSRFAIRDLGRTEHCQETFLKFEVLQGCPAEASARGSTLPQAAETRSPGAWLGLTRWRAGIKFPGRVETSRPRRLMGFGK